MLAYPAQAESSSDVWSGFRFTGPIAMAYFLAIYGPRLAGLGTIARVALGVLATALFVVLALAEVREIRKSDELQRRVKLEALAIAYAFSFLILISVTVFQRLLGFSLEWADRMLFFLLLLPYPFALRAVRERYQ